MAESSDNDEGIILSLIDRFETQSMPMLNVLNKKTERGERLNKADIEFLDSVIHEYQKNKPLIDRNPEWQEYCANVIHFYTTIISKALDNEEGL